MKSKAYKNIESESTPVVAEPLVGYGQVATCHPATMPSMRNMLQTADERVAWMEVNYDRLLTEATQKFGDKELMTPEEYFGKLWYIVEKGYEAL